MTIKINKLRKGKRRYIKYALIRMTSFPETTPINKTGGFSFVEPKTVIKRKVKNYATNLEDIFSSTPKGMGIRNAYIL